MVPALALIGSLLAAEPQTDWYGWQTLLADAASVTVGAVAVSHRNDPYAGKFPSTALVLGSIAATGYVFAPPLIHLFSTIATTGFAKSLMLRLGIPAAAGLISLGLYAAAWGSCHSTCGYALVAVDAAALTAPIVIDAAALARAPPRRLALLPIADRERLGLALACVF